MKKALVHVENKSSAVRLLRRRLELHLKRISYLKEAIKMYEIRTKLNNLKL